MTILTLGGALLPLVLVVACGDSAQMDRKSPSSELSRSALTEAESLSVDILGDYFEGVATQGVDSLQQAIDAAQPDSPAAGYAAYRQAYVRAVIDSGTTLFNSAPAIKKIEDGFQHCQSDDSDAICYRYTDISSVDGRVSNFSINGKPLARLLRVGNHGAVPFQGVDAVATLVAAFKPPSGGKLIVIANVKVGGSNGVADTAATYHSPAGHRSESTQSYGPTDIAPNSWANYAFAFQSAGLGGAITLTIDDWDSERSGIVTLKTG